jgi:N-methylhydantoinase A
MFRSVLAARLIAARSIIGSLLPRRQPVFFLHDCTTRPRLEEETALPQVDGVAHARIGIDIGGTFTDLLLVDDATGEVTIVKTLTTPADPSDAVDAAVRQALAAAGTPPNVVGNVIHGTTLVTNAIIERKGDPTALITTKGFRDVLEIRREHRYDMYDLSIEAPRELVPRYLRFEVHERILADGTILRALDEAEVERLVRAIVSRGIKAIAVSLLHAYRNPVHEQRIRDIIAFVAPDVQVSLASDVVPEIKEYERTSTTVCNAYVKSLVDRYLSELERKLREAEIPGGLNIMLSSGGIATVETSREFPIRLLESGPAAGALAAAHVGRLANCGELLSFDMGGTTAKVCLIEDGRPLRTSQLEVDRIYRFKKGSGLPIKIPVIEMIEIGAGGGSIASVDTLGLLQIGPESAGADPGPACYGRGGVLPTVTDADLVLGYLDPDFFLGGRMRLDVHAARAAIDEYIARPLGLSVMQGAWGIHHIVNENMANAARIHAIDRGKNARAFPMFAFGGAGPVHAFGVAAILHTPVIILPLGAGVASTLGFLTAPLSFDFVRTSIEPLDDIDWTRANEIRSVMEREGTALLTRSGVAADDIAIAHSADIRYIGQGHEVTIPFPNTALGPFSRQAIVDAFDTTYARMYGRVADGLALEVINWRTVVSGPSPSLDLRRQDRRHANGSDALKAHRPVYFAEYGDYHSTPVYDRYELMSGASITGPAIVEERESTAVLGPGAVGAVDEFSNLIVRMSHEC